MLHDGKGSKAGGRKWGVGVGVGVGSRKSDVGCRMSDVGSKKPKVKEFLLTGSSDF